MFEENRFIFIEIVPPYKKRKGGKLETYKPKEYSETPSGKMEKIERELSQKEAENVLERLNELGVKQCPECKSKTIMEDDEDSKFYKFKCLDCGYKWQIPRN